MDERIKELIDYIKMLQVRIYEYKAVRSKEIPTDSRCVMCGEIIPEGSMVCDRCREAVEGFE